MTIDSNHMGTVIGASEQRAGHNLIGLLGLYFE